MKQYQLTEDHQGLAKNTILEGPNIPIGNSIKMYYPMGTDPNSKYGFWEGYILSNPTIFTEIKKSPDENQGIV